MAVKTIADLAGTLRSTFKIGASYTAPVLDWDAAPKKYVDEAISGENLWDRTGTVLTTHTSGDTVSVAKIGVSSTYAVTNPATDFHVASNSESSPRGIMSSQHSDSTSSARIHGRKSRGTLASPTAVQSNDYLARWVASGYDGSNYLEMASIEMQATGTIASTRVPTAITFNTATNAAPSVLTLAMTIDNAQKVSTVNDMSVNSLTVGRGPGGISSDTVFGYNAGNGITTATDLTLIGQSAGTVLTIESFNTIVGSRAGRYLKASYNIAVGYQALAGDAVNFSTGQYNIAVGSNALVGNNTGTYNVAVGANALRANTSGAKSIGIGYGALYTTTTSDNNVAVGYQSLYNNTGANNTAIGYQAGNGITSGGYNVAIGPATLTVACTGIHNIAIGGFSTASVTSGTNNIGIGYASICLTDAGINNIAISENALYNNTSGNNNTALGMNALLTNTTGSDNIGIGYYALAVGSAPSRNTAIGTQALRYCTGTNSVALGYMAGVYDPTGSQLYIDNQDRIVTSKAFETTGTTCVVTSNAHGLQVGNSIVVRNSSNTGYLADGVNTVTAVTTNTFTITGVATGTGTCDYSTARVRALVYGVFNASPASQTLTINANETVNGTEVVQRNTGDAPTIGSELLTDSNWTLGSGWTGTWATGFAHSSGTATLTRSTAPTLNARYYVSWTNTGTTGLVSCTYGGNAFTILGTGTSGSVGLIATTTGILTLTPSTGFDGTIYLSIKQITAATTALFTLKNSTGIIQVEMRTDSIGTGTTEPNTFIGVDTGKWNYVGERNTAVGYYSLVNLTSGSDNTAVGYLTLMNATYGLGNTAIGKSSLYQNTYGSYNTAIGHNSMVNSTTGGFNLALGAFAIGGIVTGTSNLGIGPYALYSLTSGSYNIAIGDHTLYSITSGTSNIAIGRYAGSNVTTGNNVFYLGNVQQASLADDTSYSLMYGTFSGTAATLTNQALRVNATFSVNTVVSANTASPTGTVATFINANATGGVTRIMTDACIGADGTGFNAFAGRLARGTIGALSAIQANDQITNISAWGHGATGYSSVARGLISIFAAENWTDSAQGTRISLNTTAPGGTTTSEKFRVWGDGGTQIGGTFTASPGAGALYVEGGINIPSGQTYKINNTPLTSITYDTSARSHDSDGTQGQRAYNGNYIYECVVTGTGGSGRWVRYTVESDGF